MADDQSIIRQLRKEDMASQCTSIKTTVFLVCQSKYSHFENCREVFLHAKVYTSTFISSFNYNHTDFRNLFQESHKDPACRSFDPAKSGEEVSLI